MTTRTASIAQGVALVPAPVVPRSDRLPGRSLALADLLALLPPLYDTDPGAEIALAVTCLSGSATARVEGVALEIVADDPALLPFVTDLRDHTMTTLATAIQAAGYLTTVVGGWDNLAATTLIDGFYDPAGTLRLLGFTSVLWRVVRPIALAFDGWSDDLTQAARMLDVRYAEGRWLDWWGVLYGVPRVDNETDDQYRRRIVREVMAPRCNGVAMEAIIRDALGYDATIADAAVTATTWYATPVGLRFATSGPTTSEVLTTLAPYANLAAPPPIVNRAGVAAPTAPPVLTSAAAATALPAGVYRVAYTAVTAAGETTPSPEATIVLAAGDRIGHAPPVATAGATAYKYYVALPPATWATLTAASYNATTYTWATSDPNVLTWGLTNPGSVARPSLVWSDAPPLVSPTTFPRTFPGLAGWFDVAVRQVVEDGAVGEAALRSLIDRYKAAGYQFTLSIQTAYREGYDTAATVVERYAEAYDGAWGHFGGGYYVTGTLSSLTAAVPERATVIDPVHAIPLGLGGVGGLAPRVAAATAPLPVWEATILEEYNTQGTGWVPGGTGGVWGTFPDPAAPQARGLGGVVPVWRLAPPGILATG